MYQIESGNIRIGGVSLSNIDLDCLRKRVLAIVAQEPVLFKGSIKDNLLYGLESEGIADIDTRIAKALEVSCSADFVKNLAGQCRIAVASRGDAACSSTEPQSRKYQDPSRGAS